MTSPDFQLPRLRDLARQALPHVVEASIIPLVLFYGVLRFVGIWTALWVALAWCYFGLARRLVRRRPLPGLLLLAALGLTARTVVAYASGSTFIYFFQPSMTAVVVSALFLLSVPAGNPMARRLATDLFPLPETMLRRPAVARVFQRITLLWAAINLAGAVATVVLLISVSVETYVLSRTAVNLVVTGGGILVSIRWFKRALREPAPAPAESGVAA